MMKKIFILLLFAGFPVHAASVNLENLYESMESLTVSTTDCNQELEQTAADGALGPACTRFNRHWHVLQEIYDFIKKKQPEDLTLMLRDQYDDSKAENFWKLLQQTQDGLAKMQTRGYQVN